MAIGGGEIMLGAITVPVAFTPGECRRIVTLAQNSGMMPAGLGQGQSDKTIRSANVAWLDDQGDAAWVMQRIVALVSDANQHFNLDLADFSERIQVARYHADIAGHFDWHADIGSGDLAAKRKLTLVVQLSKTADYHGGILQTWSGNQPLAANQAQGAATLFPAFTLHRVTPVTIGERWSLTTWVHGPGFK